MRKVQDAFTKITLTTIRDVRNFLDKSDKELAEELGIKDLYDQLVDGEQDSIDSSDVNEDSEETDNIQSEIN